MPKDLTPDESRKFLSLFDSSTFVYDNIWKSNLSQGVLITPPLNKIHADFIESALQSGGNADVKWLVGSHHCRISYRMPSGCNSVAIGSVAYDNSVYHPLLAFLECVKPRRISFTLQKDNQIESIVDWVQHQLTVCKADAVIIYDNNSSVEYTASSLSNCLDNCFPGLTFVLSVPFKYGPSGGRFGFDNKFLQHACWEHIRSSVLLSGVESSVLLNTDIDELVFVNDHLSPFELLESKVVDAIHFHGYWCFPQSLPNHSERIAHSDHTMIDAAKSPCPTKWLFKIQQSTAGVMLTPHSVIGSQSSFSDKLVYLHHKFISTNWKYNRTKSIDFNAEAQSQHIRLPSRDYVGIMDAMNSFRST